MLRRLNEDTIACERLLQVRNEDCTAARDRFEIGRQLPESCNLLLCKRVNGYVGKNMFVVPSSLPPEISATGVMCI